MKITTWVHLEPVEVEVDIDLRDALAQIDSSDFPEIQEHLLRRIVRFGELLMAVSDETIAGLQPAPRETISKFLREQGERWRPKEDEP